MAHLTMSSITGICEKGLGQLGEEHLQNRGHFVDLRRKIKHLQYNIKSKLLVWISDTNCSVPLHIFGPMCPKSDFLGGDVIHLL